MKEKLGIVGALALGLAAVAGYFAWPQHGSQSLSLLPEDGRVVALGSGLYKEHCAACHGKNLEGQPNWRTRDAEGYLPAPPHDESGHTWHHADALLIRMTKQGIAGIAGPDYKTRMPAYDGILSDAEIIAVLSYIKSRWPEKIRQRHDQLNQAAKGQ